MAARLRLAAWTGTIRDEYLKSEAQVAKFHALPPTGRVLAAKNQADVTFYKALALAVAIHLTVFSLAMPVLDVQPEKQATPILVSLSSPSQPEIAVVPEPKVEQTPPPIIKKQGPLPKNIQPAPQPNIQKSTTPVKVATPEAAPVQEPAPAQVSEAAETVAKAAQPEVIESKVEPKVEPQPELKVEPPKFGAAYLHNPAPAYPALSRRMGEEGRVVLRVLVSINGEAGTVQIETGSGYERLDQAALESVKKWRFIPAKQNDQPISAYVLVPVKFSLNS